MWDKIKKHNIWKWLFFSLLAINAGVLFYLLLLFNSSPADPIFQTSRQEESTDVEFTIVSDKRNLNQLINRYLDQLSTSTSISYSVFLDKKVRLSGSIRAFNQEIPATVVLDPVVQKNGDLVLQQESISLGRLQLPNRKVLEYIQGNYEMPEWIEVNPDNENIYVAITEISKNDQIQVQAQQFDLDKDRISFSIHAPYETLPFNERKIMKYFK
ncbi:YpmS family protein [Bacillus piscicola]|uniref:YpmS family protein n=1 Tax=Bacillus piscicola TaxID=1632684 RepID=UPI001F08A603|nr:YpmS family protein [Bacillus piscicola]